MSSSQGIRGGAAIIALGVLILVFSAFFTESLHWSIPSTAFDCGIVMIFAGAIVRALEIKFHRGLPL